MDHSAFERVPGRRRLVLTLAFAVLALIAGVAGSWWRTLKAQHREALRELVESDSRRIAALNTQVATLQEAYAVVEDKARTLSLYDWEVQSRLLTSTRAVTYGERVSALEQDNASRLERIHLLRQQVVVLVAELAAAKAELEEK